MKKETTILIIFAIGSVIAISGCIGGTNSITTDILNSQNCSLNASLFTNPDNTEKDDFTIEDTASSADIEFSGNIDPTAYTRTKSNIKSGAETGKETTIGGITGYLVQDITGLSFYFVKDGITYAISGTPQNGTSTDDIRLATPRGLSVQGAFADILKEWNK
ncbi:MULTISPECIES: hypothetical protein [Methanobacterium]|uniref:Lipoprotein n=1 Tax=Methanobacterium veterum TaxID=408577 RepID=A0A9E4ZWI2_9EURY|nr:MULTISPECIES: hypothetical protein [Methanobacterium]MCZ3365391.1 hypothetical protein [Methanobacterium veterum]MCZ3373142.1 hypothetical protein [Methanobacterium veterum]